MNDLENEKEWRRVIYHELIDLRKDLQGFKMKMFAMITAITALANTISYYILKK